MSDRPPAPWDAFLSELDQLLPEPMILHCAGGFVMIVIYGMPRSTSDIDALELIPPSGGKALAQLGGLGSGLYRKYAIYVQAVGMADMPEDYDTRLTEMFPAPMQSSAFTPSKRTTWRCPSWAAT